MAAAVTALDSGTLQLMPPVTAPLCVPRQGPRSRSPASDVQLDSAACLDRRIR